MIYRYLLVFALFFSVTFFLDYPNLLLQLLSSLFAVTVTAPLLSWKGASRE
ncbi:hypothetical protein [Planomicrobium sp. CPCC 101110]|uniref:hypothetical protein n=1 Tax=Planomicrobium sp. CPCC 101110 TaxID=2599619 RepID=UPI0016497494|nr:hypothetical protein [Planomicrobium sp. CPCC 101110]